MFYTDEPDALAIARAQLQFQQAQQQGIVAFQELSVFDALQDGAIRMPGEGKQNLGALIRNYIAEAFYGSPQDERSAGALQRTERIVPARFPMEHDAQRHVSVQFVKLKHFQKDLLPAIYRVRVSGHDDNFHFHSEEVSVDLNLRPKSALKFSPWIGFGAEHLSILA